MSGAETTSARETHRRKRKRGTAEETAEYNAKSIKHDRSEVVREESKSTFLVVFWKDELEAGQSEMKEEWKRQRNLFEGCHKAPRWRGRSVQKILISKRKLEADDTGGTQPCKRADIKKVHSKKNSQSTKDNFLVAIGCVVCELTIDDLLSMRQVSKAFRDITSENAFSHRPFIFSGSVNPFAFNLSKTTEVWVNDMNCLRSGSLNALAARGNLHLIELRITEHPLAPESFSVQFSRKIKGTDYVTYDWKKDDMELVIYPTPRFPNYSDKVVLQYQKDKFLRVDVTNSPSTIRKWVEKSSKSVVHFGLDAEGFKDGILLLQISTLDEVLLCHLGRCDFVPEELVTFLAEEDFKFWGRGINEDLESLMGWSDALEQKPFQGLCENFKQFSDLTEVCCSSRRNGLEDLSSSALGLRIKPSRSLTKSWDDELADDQVAYAALDAFAGVALHQHFSSSDPIKRRETADEKKLRRRKERRWLAKQKIFHESRDIVTTL